MKRRAPRALGGPSREGTEAKVSSGVSCPGTGRWTLSAIPQTWTSGTCIQDGDQIWPDCRD